MAGDRKSARQRFPEQLDSVKPAVRSERFPMEKHGNRFPVRLCRGDCAQIHGCFKFPPKLPGYLIQVAGVEAAGSWHYDHVLGHSRKESTRGARILLSFSIM